MYPYGYIYYLGISQMGMTQRQKDLLAYAKGRPGGKIVISGAWKRPSGGFTLWTKADLMFLKSGRKPTTARQKGLIRIKHSRAVRRWTNPRTGGSSHLTMSDILFLLGKGKIAVKNNCGKLGCIGIRRSRKASKRRSRKSKRRSTRRKSRKSRSRSRKGKSRRRSPVRKSRRYSRRR